MDGSVDDPLHGVTLRMMVERLQERLGWDGLAAKVPVKCFENDPSVESSLKFLRRTAWAREKVELLYVYSFHPKRAGELARRRRQDDRGR
ncbi:MAG: hypothetical protein CVV47_14050 [Spirochaetae bacterium HGW-Spirochaetae-3]|jgi:uncharacterized protein (DUF2132 family)|nr:MAG: hypothetical protein CVV47_14050 [Spirochaetae bacterium HGW-Spirochaetae-3]